MLMALLSGCSPNTAAMHTSDMANSGSWWTRNVVYWFSLMLDEFAEWFGGSYGLSILLLTIIVRTLILPLMIKQYKNTKAMQALQPEMKKVREKFKDDPKKQQEEMMKLYQTHQVNPLAGCLPLIVQMPIFIALYNSIYKNVEIREHTFIGFQLGLTPNNSGHWYYYLIPIVAALTTLIQSLMMAQQQTMVGPMKGLMYIFPIMIFVMAINFPVALPLYWIYSNIYTITQNYFMYRNSPKPNDKPEDNPPSKQKPKPSGKSGKGKGARA
ncbi:YidC/Oxa1 family membrane protein insertase [Cohnella suwonensis]|uniref:YidC/Oxa1 family membrane protein insertase n=1 Tax=Cohnella suwonensis TaxID=696072 RepID=A0ABW0LU99_9BACL